MSKQQRSSGEWNKLEDAYGLLRCHVHEAAATAIDTAEKAIEELDELEEEHDELLAEARLLRSAFIQLEKLMDAVPGDFPEIRAVILAYNNRKDESSDMPCFWCDESGCTDGDGMMHPDICNDWNDWSELR